MKKFFFTLLTIFFAYYCAYNTSGASKKQELFSWGNSLKMYKFICAITGKTDTTDAKDVFKRGERYFLDNQFDLALKDMIKVLSLDSAHYRVRYIMAKSYLSLGDTFSAISFFKMQVTHSYEQEDSYFELGNIFKNKGLLDSSFYYYKKTYEINNSGAAINFEMANYYFKTTKYSEALEFINRAIESEEYNLDYRNLRRQIYIKQNQQVLADQDYQFIVSTNADYFGNYKAKAEEQKSNNNFQAAIEYYKLALNEDPNNRELIESKAWAYSSLEQYDSAYLDMAKTIELYPDYLSYFNVAYILDLGNKIKESIENYNKSIEAKGDYYLSYHNRAVEFYKMKNFKKAEEDYSKSIEIKSDYYLSYYNRGLLYYETKKYEKAVIDFVKALEYEKEDPDITYSLALTYERLKKKEDAVNTYNDYLKLAGENDSIRIEVVTKKIAELTKTKSK